MKQTGNRAEFAAGVEACASAGGMIMPPIMGVTAFVMAEYMGIAYIDVALAAAIPATLYFFASIFVRVHLEAKRSVLPALPKELLPDLWYHLKREWNLLIPLVVIVGILLAGYTVSMAAFGGVVSVYLSTLIRKKHRMSPVAVLSALDNIHWNVDCCHCGDHEPYSKILLQYIHFVSFWNNLFEYHFFLAYRQKGSIKAS